MVAARTKCTTTTIHTERANQLAGITVKLRQRQREREKENKKQERKILQLFVTPAWCLMVALSLQSKCFVFA